MHKHSASLALLGSLLLAALTASCGSGGGALNGPLPGASPTPVASTSPSPAASSSPQSVAFISLPSGFHAWYVSKHVPGARFMAFAPNGDLLVAETSIGQVVVIPPGLSPDAQPAGFAAHLSLPDGLRFFQS